MKPSQILKALPALAAARQPVMLWGPPGVGKSQLVRRFAEKLGGGFIDLRLPLLDAVDMRGIPTVDASGDEHTTKWLTPDMFPRDGKGVLFLDELPQAAPIVQAAASQLILDRRIGDYVLPDGWVILSAGNRDSDRAATNRMPSHIANRFTHLDYEVDYQDWYAWAEENGVNPMVHAFLQFKPELMHKFVPTDKAFPTPRSWEFVSNLLNMDEDGLDDCLLEVVTGTVGAGAAVEFVGFVRVFRDLPDYEAIRDNPTKTKVPAKADVKYAVANMLAARTTKADMKPIMTYVDRLPDEFQILCTQEMCRRTPALAETVPYIRWVADNKDLLLNATER